MTLKGMMPQLRIRKHRKCDCARDSESARSGSGRDVVKATTGCMSVISKQQASSHRLIMMTI
jgi:hypothetical protein